MSWLWHSIPHTSPSSHHFTPALIAMLPFYKSKTFPQSHMLICPELNQTQTLPQYECDVYYFFDRKSETWFFNSFAKVPQDVQRTQHYHPPSGDLFERLPNELIDEIIEYLIPRSSDLLNASTAALEDYLGLGLSSARLWPLVLQRIHASYARVSMSGSWACKKVGFHSRNSTLNARQIANYNLKEPGDGRQVHRSFCRCPPCLRSHTRTDNYSGMFLSSWEWDTASSHCAWKPQLNLSVTSVGVRRPSNSETEKGLGG
jgi:hypothetical protein